jgi:hypothetical protein
MTRNQFEDIRVFFSRLRISEHLVKRRDGATAKVTYSYAGEKFTITNLRYATEVLIGPSGNVRHLVLDIEEHDWPTDKDPSADNVIDEMVDLCGADKADFRQFLLDLRDKIRAALRDGMRGMYWPNILNNNHWHDVARLIQVCLEAPEKVEGILKGAKYRSTTRVVEDPLFNRLVYDWVPEKKRKRNRPERRAFRGKYKMITKLLAAAHRSTDPPPTQELKILGKDERTLGDIGRLDAKLQIVARKEQGFLRSKLFGGQSKGRCGLCGELFPIDLLVAAHIKRRANCTDEEKHDLSNIMPMCRLGCDELFERGYIRIVQGKIELNQAKASTGSVRQYLNRLSGRLCEHWSNSTEKYFKWRNGVD